MFTAHAFPIKARRDSQRNLVHPQFRSGFIKHVTLLPSRKLVDLEISDSKPASSNKNKILYHFMDFQSSSFGSRKNEQAHLNF